ncbi:MAG: hypothetical protein ABIQ82_09280 [Variovorax sp.]
MHSAFAFIRLHSSKGDIVPTLEAVRLISPPEVAEELEKHYPPRERLTAPSSAA